MPSNLEALRAELAQIQVSRPIGRITELSHGILDVSGLSNEVALSDRVEIHGADGVIGGEVLRLTRDRITVLSDAAIERLEIGDAVLVSGRATIAPDNSWIGRVIDPLGRPLDDRPLQRGPQLRALRHGAPAAIRRKPLGGRLETGLRTFNTLLPLVRGQRLGLFAGSGVGKSLLLAKFARRVEADVVVIALIGERGRELRTFTETVLGPEGMARSVVIAATSDQAPLIRRRCAWTAMAVAEHFRDQGLHVLLLADSITRFAEAHREVALSAGESASLQGYPPSLSHALMALAERAGPGEDGSGDITAILTVLVAGSDMEGPVADILRGTLDGHIVLDRQIAERGRYPAIDLLRSISRSLPDAASPEENRQIAEARRLLGAYEKAELMIHAGLYAKGSDPLIDRAIRAWPHLDSFLSQDEDLHSRESFRQLGLCLDPP